MFSRLSRKRRRPASWYATLLFSVMCVTLPAGAQVGSILHLDTEANNSKSNQNRIWHHDGKWWAIARYEPGNADYIWRYDGAGVWTRTGTKLEKGVQNRYDVIMDSDIGELVIVRSHTTQIKFYRYSYNAGAWEKEEGATILNFGNADNVNPVTVAKAKNGEFWIFEVDTNKVQAVKSSDGGETWSGIILIKTGLLTTTGTTDAVTFTAGGHNYLGVAYGETGAAGLNTAFGFLYHRDGDADNAWTDETSSLSFFGAEKGNNALSMIVDRQNNIYLFTRTFGGGGSDARNTLYKRTGTNAWSRFAVNTVSDLNWNSPAVAIDTSGNFLIVAGIRTDSAFAEYKLATLGSESSLLAATRRVLMQDNAELFENVNLPRQHLNSLYGMLATAGNGTENSTWFNQVFPTPAVPVFVDTVKVVSNEVNARGRYTIPIQLTDLANGALTAGVGTISLRFPSTTIVPAGIAAGHVTVNGNVASAVATNPAFREATITTPVNLPGGALVTVVIDSLANVINPQKIGRDSLQAWTSKQPTPVYSPRYWLVRATTKVTPALVTVIPSDPDSAGSYVVKFNLGNHGRTLAGTDSINVRFGPATRVRNGVLDGVTVNLLPATATGDTLTQRVYVTIPAGLNFLNNDSVSLYLPTSAIRNPALAGFYTLHVSTSVETTMVASQPYQIMPSLNCGVPIPGTYGNFAKSNQSKTFYHGGYWWLIAPYNIDKRWYLWKHDGLSWIRGIQVSSVAKDRPDVWLEAGNNKLYMLLPGGNTTRLSRLSFSGGTWTVDGGYPKTVNNVQDDGSNIVRALNGHLWVFWMADSTLRAQRSGDEGATWTPVIDVKSHLNEQEGLTDAVAFQAGGDAIGVGYAEDSGVSGARYGFLYHKDSDPDNVWTDETSKLATFAATTSDDHISMTAYNNEIFLIAKTKGGGSNTIKNALYHRKTNNTWTRYTIITGNGWTRPAVTIDVSNNVLYVLGTREGKSRNVEMKRVALGNYSSLLSAPIDTLLCDPTDSFFDITSLPHHITNASGYMVVAKNETDNDLWYRRLVLSALPKSAAGGDAEEETAIAGLIGDYKLTAEVYPNPFNPRTTIRFHLREAAPVKLQIFNISGQLVRTLIDGELPAGSHQRHWNARNHNGETVATGTYIYRLQAGGRLVTGRMQLLR